VIEEKPSHAGIEDLEEKDVEPTDVRFLI